MISSKTFEPDKTYLEKIEGVAEEIGDTQGISRMKFFASQDNNNWERIPNTSLDRLPKEGETVRAFSTDYIYVLTANDWGSIHTIYFARRPEVL